MAAALAADRGQGRMGPSAHGASEPPLGKATHGARGRSELGAASRPPPLTGQLAMRPSSAHLGPALRPQPDDPLEPVPSAAGRPDGRVPGPCPCSRRPGLCPTPRGEQRTSSRRGQEGARSSWPAATERSHASCKLSQVVEGVKPSSTRSTECHCHGGTIADRAGRTLGRRGGWWELLTCDQARSPRTSPSPLRTHL